jgi:uncharacterized MAPEG superfamily protein
LNQQGTLGASFNLPAGTLPLGNGDILTASYSPDTTAAAVYSPATGTTAVTVTPVPVPAFTLAGYPLTVHQGQYLNNTTEVSTDWSGGFTGNIALTAAVTASPANAQDPPTLSLSPATLNVNNNYPISTVTVTTTLATGNRSPARSPVASLYTAGALSFACLLFLVSPARLRFWRSMLGTVLLLMTFAGAMVGCGGGSSGGGGGGGKSTGNPGTTKGVYTVTVTGTSGTLTASCTFTVTVQ